MTKKLSITDILLEQIRSGRDLTRSQQFSLLARLSIPAMIAQLATIVMNYIDASMVGHLGAEASASVGLMTTSVWFFGGLCNCFSNGFGVQVAHCFGANDIEGAKQVLRQGLIACATFGLFLGTVAFIISPYLPLWLGGGASIVGDASAYFMIYAFILPILQLNLLSTSILRCSGNVKFPSMLNILMCLLDVFFNLLLIYPSHNIKLWGHSIYIPSAGLGVVGAALGTALAAFVTGTIMVCYLVFKSPSLRIYNKGFGEWSTYKPTKHVLSKAFKIGTPMAFQHVAICSAQIFTTIIVAPLGKYAISANAFGVTAESLCYMPGFGISDAATTLVGQSIGAGRKPLAKRFAYQAVGVGIMVMTIMGIFLYVGAPVLMELFSPVKEIIDLGVDALRIEAFAEPLFAAAIVSYGCFVGAGSTLIPAFMNLGSIWGLRLTLAFLLAPQYGLTGVWTAMAIELSFRGIIFLIRLFRGKWLTN